MQLEIHTLNKGKLFIISRNKYSYIDFIFILASTLVMSIVYIDQRFYLPIIFIITLYIYFRMTSIFKETLLVFPLGIQLESHSLVSKRIKFIPKEKIEEIVILEGIYRWQVVFYLGIKTDGLITVCFRELLPRLHLLERIYIELQK